VDRLESNPSTVLLFIGLWLQRVRVELDFGQEHSHLHFYYKIKIKVKMLLFCSYFLKFLPRLCPCRDSEKNCLFMLFNSISRCAKTILLWWRCWNFVFDFETLSICGSEHLLCECNHVQIKRSYKLHQRSWLAWIKYLASGIGKCQKFCRNTKCYCWRLWRDAPAVRVLKWNSELVPRRPSHVSRRTNEVWCE